MSDHQGNIMNFTGTYEELTQTVASSVGLVVVDFTAQWCPPCRRLGELLPTIASEFPKVMFLKVNTDEARELTTHYGVCSIPHIKFLKAGQGNQIQELASITGADVAQIRNKIQQFSN